MRLSRGGGTSIIPTTTDDSVPDDPEENERSPKRGKVPERGRLEGTIRPAVAAAITRIREAEEAAGSFSENSSHGLDSHLNLFVALGDHPAPGDETRDQVSSFARPSLY